MCDAKDPAANLTDGGGCGACAWCCSQWRARALAEKSRGDALDRSSRTVPAEWAREAMSEAWRLGYDACGGDDVQPDETGPALESDLAFLLHPDRLGPPPSPSLTHEAGMTIAKAAYSLGRAHESQWASGVEAPSLPPRLASLVAAALAPKKREAAGGEKP